MSHILVINLLKIILVVKFAIIGHNINHVTVNLVYRFKILLYNG